MNPKHLQDAIGNIDDAFIEEAAKSAKIYPKIWIPAAALAACALLTVSLLPWKTILSNNGSSETDPYHSGIVSDFLLQDDTTYTDDTTKDTETLPVTDPAQSTALPDTFESEDPTPPLPPKAPDLSKDTLPPVSSDTEAPYPDSTEGSRDEETTAIDKEPSGPLIPNIPSTPDQGTTIPQRPTVLSHSLYPVQEQYPQELSLRPQWRSAKNERISYYTSRIGDTDSFMYSTLSQFFSNSKNENLIYSPVNAYMSLGMLTEAVKGSGRTQLLSLLGENDIYSLRSSAESLWNSCYRDDGIVTSVLGNSVWLDNSFTPKTAVTDIIAKNYYASSFWGDMGDEEYDELMRSWLNEQTKGSLENTLSDSSLDPESTISLISTLYFKADWAVKFDAESTRSRVFHSPDGDVTAQFMYRDFIGLRYAGKNFETTYLELEEGGEMWFILPNENVSLQSLFSDPEAMGFITGQTQKTLSYKDYSKYMWLFLPKFDINSQIGLGDSLKSLGVTDVFDSDKADLSYLTDSNIFLSDITQSARICIDESGCEAAAASGGILPGDGDIQPFGFTLDRPFIFVVTSDSGLPLFVGTVNRPASQ